MYFVLDLVDPASPFFEILKFTEVTSQWIKRLPLLNAEGPKVIADLASPFWRLCRD